MAENHLLWHKINNCFQIIQVFADKKAGTMPPENHESNVFELFLPNDISREYSSHRRGTERKADDDEQDLRA